MQLFGAATAAAIAEGFALVLTSSPAGGADANPILDTVPLDGAIVVDPVVDDPVIRRLRHRGVTVVTTGRVPGEARDQGLWVDNDHRQATRSALDHLHRAGGARPGIVTSAPVTTYVTETLEAHREWCAERGIRCVSPGRPASRPRSPG